MKLKADSVSFSHNCGETLLSFRLGNIKLNELEEQVLKLKDKPVTLEFKRWRNSRSTDANAYFWKLCTLIANVLDADKDDVYKQMITDTLADGTWIDGDWENEKIKAICEMWSKKGLGWISDVIGSDEKMTRIRLYMGSSAYDTKQMSQLIKTTIRQAEELGIPTLTDEEVNEMLRRHKAI